MFILVFKVFNTSAPMVLEELLNEAEDKNDVENNERRFSEHRCSLNGNFEIPGGDMVFFVYSIIHAPAHKGDFDIVSMTNVQKQIAEEMWKINKEICRIDNEILSEYQTYWETKTLEYIVKRQENLAKQEKEYKARLLSRELPILHQTQTRARALIDILEYTYQHNKPVHQRLYDLISQDESLCKEIKDESKNATVCEEYFDNDTTFNEVNCDEYKNNQDNEVICEKYDGDGLNVNGLTHNETIEIDKLWENEPGFKRYEEEIFPLSKKLVSLLGQTITVYAKPGQFVSCGIYDAFKLPEDISFSYSLSGQNERLIKINRLIYRNGAVNVTYLYESNSNSDGNGRFKVCSRLNLPAYLS